MTLYITTFCPVAPNQDSTLEPQSPIDEALSAKPLVNLGRRIPLFRMAEIQAHLASSIRSWSIIKVDGTYAITRTYDFQRYKAAAEFVQDLVAIVQKAKHHPEITLSFRKVAVTIYTHDGYLPLDGLNLPSPGISDRDIQLAREFDNAWATVDDSKKK